MDKKGVQLAVYTMVILILAIAALGLGIYFMRSSMEKARTQAEGAVKSTEIQANPTKDNPVALVPTILELRKKEKGKAVIYFLNPDEAKNYCFLNIHDPNGQFLDENSNFKDHVIYAGEKIGIGPGDIATWTIAIDTLSDIFAQGQQYMFTNTLYCGDRDTMDNIMKMKAEERDDAIATNPGMIGRFQKNLIVKIE